MKKIILVAAISLVGMTFSFAQGKGKAKGHEHAKGQHANLTPEQRVEKQVTRLKTQLSLTDAQVPQVTQIVKTKVDKMEALRAKKSTEGVEKGERKAIMTSFNTELNNVLTAEQKQKYEAMKADKKAKHQAKKGAKAITNEEIDVLED